ncbi:ATP-binding protein, partial [Nocardioides hankookensis]
RSLLAVTLTATAATVQVRVRDDGDGVPPADRERVFERFVRLDEARTRDDGGSGLGLAITRLLVQEHGGTIRLEDAPNGGAEVVIELPRASVEV